MAATTTGVITPYPSSFGRYFRIMQNNDIFESFVPMTVQIKVFAPPDLQTCYSTVICIFTIFYFHTVTSNFDDRVNRDESRNNSNLISQAFSFLK